jgi:hypothetical protein
MHHFYRSIQPGVTFLLLVGLAWIQGCWNQPKSGDQPPSGDPDFRGVEREMDAIALRQIEEYNKTGKFSAPAKRGKYCHNHYSHFSPSDDAVTNFAIDEPCLVEKLIPMFADDANEVSHYVSKLFVIPNGAHPNKKIVELQCGPPFGYLATTLDNQPLEPRLVRGRFPECPPMKEGSRSPQYYNPALPNIRVLPLYRDHSKPQKLQVLVSNEKVIQELDKISDQQVQEFTKTGQYSSALSFNPECSRFVSSLLDDGKTVVNWILPKHFCKPEPTKSRQEKQNELIGNSSDSYKFVSAVFAVENKQTNTVALSRIVCEVDITNVPPDIVQYPPALVNGVPECSTVNPNHPSVKKILVEKYPPVPAR